GGTDAPIAEQAAGPLTDAYAPPPSPSAAYRAMAPAPASMAMAARELRADARPGFNVAPPAANTERYEGREDNPVQRPTGEPVATVSVDVDTGSYANVRRMLRTGVRPHADAVRVEEMLNYFDYGHPAPASRQVPFRVTTELAPAPWNPKRQLLMVGVKGYDVDKSELPASNLVL